MDVASPASFIKTAVKERSMAGAKHLHVIVSEVNVISAAMRKVHRRNQEDRSQLLDKVLTLKHILGGAEDLDQIDAKTFLLPFLDIIRAEDTSAVITNLALSTVNKIITCRMLDHRNGQEVATVVDLIADAVTHTRFVGQDPASDESVLMSIIHVLKNLLASPPGNLLTNESVCEIAGSLFRMCLEPRLTELLRRVCDTFLDEVIQHIFLRLPEFVESQKDIKRAVRKLHRLVTKRKAPGPPVQAATTSEVAGDRNTEGTGRVEDSVPQETPTTEHAISSTRLPNVDEPANSVTVDGSCLSTKSNATGTDIMDDASSLLKIGQEDATWTPAEVVTMSEAESEVEDEPEAGSERGSPEEPPKDRMEFVNEKGITFRTAIPKNDETGAYIPYGLPAIQEILRFMITLVHPYDKNSENNLNLGLRLLGSVMETSARALPRYTSLMALIKDDLCRNLNFLLQSERLSIFTLTLQLAFFVFDPMRSQCKLQLETFLTTLMSVVAGEAPKVTLEHKEAAVDTLLRFFKLPDFISEIYRNYDCDMYCSNLFEDLTKLLSKNAFPVNSLNLVHLLSLECLLTAIDNIEKNCQKTSQLPEDAAKEFRDGIRPELQSLRNCKKMLNTGIELFNTKPSKGIEYLQKNHILSEPLVTSEVIRFLRENYKLDKAMIADYLGNRKNVEVLPAFNKSFNFAGKRIDEALREYLEAFRLPGESPLIAHFMEHFAANWHTSNRMPFRHQDCAFTLAYAILMLNTDLHTKKGGKLHKPMSIEEFKKMVKGINADKSVTYPPDTVLDLDSQFLETLYDAIKRDEIIMPAEQVGLVKEMYDWKVLLRRSKDQRYVFGVGGALDADIFALLWGPTVAALSYAFDKTTDDNILRRSISGFKKCAIIAASPNVQSSEVFDNIVVTLCKFSTLQNSYESISSLAVAFGQNMKAQLATKTVFSLAHRHGDILREGWKNIVDCVVLLFRAKLLPEDFTQGEDFVKGLVPLLYEDATPIKQEGGLLSALVSYITSDSSKSSTMLHEENEYRKMARACIDECEIKELVKDSKFLRSESLKEFLGALMTAHRNNGQRNAEPASPVPSVFAEEQLATICLELLVRVLIENRDRIGEPGAKIWPSIHEYLHATLLQEGKTEMSFRSERAVVGLLRLAVRFLRRHDTEIQQDIMRSLRLLLGLRPQFFYRMSRQVANALYQLFQANGSSSIKSRDDWKLLCTLLECAGAGVRLQKITHRETMPKSESQPVNAVQPDNEVDRGYTSDSELHEIRASPTGSNTWLMVGREGEVVETAGNPEGSLLSIPVDIVHHDMDAFCSAIDSLHFLIRETGQVTIDNVPALVHCLCVFVEASMNGLVGINQRIQANTLKQVDSKLHRNVDRRALANKAHSSPSSPGEEDNQQSNGRYQQRTIQLLDLIHCLHIRVTSVYRGSSVEGALWSEVWCPLLRGIARVCCDNRKSVRLDGLNYLHRALLIPDLQALSASEWEDCLHMVLFPLLSSMKQNINPQDRIGMEETRVRVASLLCKVFLQHLTPLLTLPSFDGTWMAVLEHLEQYLKLDAKSDLLKEAVLESIKNMLLVMSTAGVFHDYQGPLWDKTRTKVETIVPGLTQQLVEPAPPATRTEKPNSPVDSISVSAARSPSTTPSPVSFDSLQASSAPPNDMPGLPLLLDPGILQGFTIPSSPPPEASMPETVPHGQAGDAGRLIHAGPVLQM